MVLVGAPLVTLFTTLLSPKLMICPPAVAESPVTLPVKVDFVIHAWEPSTAKPSPTLPDTVKFRRSMVLGGGVGGQSGGCGQAAGGLLTNTPPPPLPAMMLSLTVSPPSEKPEPRCRPWSWLFSMPT